MITRIWHGYTTPERADEYEALLKAEVMKGIEAKNIAGLRNFDVLRRPLGDEVEFITVMEFDSIDSVKAFVGEDHEQAYVPDEARAILSRFDERSQHYEVRDSRTYGETAEAVRAFSAPSDAGSYASEAAAAESMEPVIPAETPPAAQPARQAILPEGAWFVRSNKGNGSLPVTHEGYRVVRNFIYGMLGFGIVGGAMAGYGAWAGPSWLVPAGPILFAVGAALSAFYFINTARRHTDYSTTYRDYAMLRRGGQV